MRISAYLCYFARILVWKALEAKMMIFMHFGVNGSQEEAMDIDATLPRELKTCICNGFGHLGKLKQKRSKRSRC